MRKNFNEDRTRRIAVKKLHYVVFEENGTYEQEKAGQNALFCFYLRILKN